MKNIQVVDSAVNATLPIHSISDEDFALIFPEPGQDIEFIEDVIARMGERAAGELVRRTTWPDSKIKKTDAMGVHGTLYFERSMLKKYFPNKRDDDWDNPSPRVPRSR